MADINYGEFVPSPSSSEQELIREAFVSMENQPPTIMPPVQPQTGWLGAPITTIPVSMLGQPITPVVQPASTIQAQPVSTLISQPVQPYQYFQPAQTSWIGRSVSQEAWPTSQVTSTSITASTTQFPIANSVLTSNAPLEVTTETETVTVQGETGVLVNRQDIVNWSGPLPISEYPINEDPNPEVIRKSTAQQLNYIQEIAVRYLKPPSPPPPGDIIIRHDKNTVPPPAPPIVIRQQPPRPETPQPLVIREMPPQMPPRVETKVITISGKRLPPPPRKVIIERLPPLPAKPQTIIVERWLPFRTQRRRVIYQKPTEADVVYEKPKNVIIQWEAPTVTITRQFRDLGVVSANPGEYLAKYGSSVVRSSELPDYVRNFRPPEGITLASEETAMLRYELEGDIQALSLVDLDREGLSEYRNVVSQTSTIYSTPIQQQTTVGQSKIQTSQVSQGPTSDIGPIVNQTIESVKTTTKDRIDFVEAKTVIKTLNERLNRKYDEQQAERFLESIGLMRDGSLDLQTFKNALLRNLQFYSIFMF